MKKIKIILAVSLALMTMSACSLSSILNPDESTIIKKIVGTWYVSLINSSVCPSNEMEVSVFNDGSTGKWCHIENGQWVETVFTYKVTGQYVTQMFPNGETKKLRVASIGNNTMLVKDDENGFSWNLLKISHNYNQKLVGTWKRTTMPLNEPNTLNDVYTLNADGTYSMRRAATGITVQGSWKAYGCVLYLSEETYLTRTMTSATRYDKNMSWQTVTADHQPSACAMKRIY
ncbi:MAG: hypothetical protein IKS33_09350 [Bacteroidales bacterium]|nr:hypothetical protein [Bacteroidales bacterium]MBR4454444.1 hypothetical protein [Bacteroidales bacterium]MCR5555045.1 hypothetical protein [Bacteroidales bacterium]